MSQSINYIKVVVNPVVYANNRVELRVDVETYPAGAVHLIQEVSDDHMRSMFDRVWQYIGERLKKEISDKDMEGLSP